IKNNTRKKMLTNYLGHTGFSEIETGRDAIKLRPGDKVILCSDGVYNSISELELERILSRKLTPSKAAEEIIESILQKRISNQDNASIIILEKCH
ncbi:MAG TPA: SpoIIE family protein phosphatase, partial [Clostridia bacterium]